ncbi:MAG: flagellar type III secretion system pore protein FliP [Lachnospiraceae bacterium]|nr:flagellar type III secretion system pore protein FliP [Lachnospiraceae bacterium]
MIRKIKRFICIFLLFSFVIFCTGSDVYATEDETNGVNDEVIDEIELDSADDAPGLLGINISSDSGDVSSALQIVILLTIIALCPSILIMLTSFTRIIVVMYFTRSALNTQTSPPNQVLIGLSLFLTFFIMSPVFNDIYENAYKPFSNHEISQSEFFDEAIGPLREFMLNQIDERDLKTMCDIAKVEDVESVDDIPTSVVIPSFIIGELRTAFWIGFLIYIPFIVIDMLVSSVLMSMGMMMLPPTTISMPFKILFFILADGWNLIIVNLMETFRF